MTQMALVIDLNVCVGCHACVTSCKEWNTSGEAGSLADFRPYDADPSGTFFNRVQTFEAGEFPLTETVHFPKSCLHCEDPPCVPVCPTGASYKRKEDGLVLVDYDKCIGCNLCHIACEDGAHQCIDLVAPDGHGLGPGRVPGKPIPQVREADCVGCNLCSLVCPVDQCITMVTLDTGAPKMSWTDYQGKVSRGEIRPIPPHP